MGVVECVVDCKAWLGESPLWSPDEKCLYWTDVPSYTVHRWHPASGETKMWKMPEMVTAMSLRARGGMIIATTSRVDFWDPETGARERVCAPESSIPINRSNDGKCDRQGRFWFGSMQNNLNADGTPRPIEGSTGNLYRVDPDGSFQHFESNIGVSNTFAWSPDDTIMYFADTFVGIYAYDFDADSGATSNRRLFAKTEHEALGFPDGSTIDSEGFIWNARWDGGCLIRWAPDGTIDRTVAFPCSRVTSAIFGGDDLDVLYVTTARYDLSEAERAEQPLAGGIFALDTGTKGIAEVPFAG
jgi:L-arabinonolactonase